MRTGLFSCLSLLQQGNEITADGLVLVPHEQTHGPLGTGQKLGPDLTEMGAIKHTMELIAHSLCFANGAPAKVARKGWPGKTWNAQPEKVSKNAVQDVEKLTFEPKRLHEKMQLAVYIICWSMDAT